MAIRKDKGLKTTDDIDVQVLLEELEAFIYERYVDAPKVTFGDDFMRPVSSPKVRVPTHVELEAQKLEEGAQPDFQKLPEVFNTYYLNVYEYVIATGITRNLVEDSGADEVKWHAMEALKAMEKKRSDIIIEALDDGLNDAAYVPQDYGDNSYAAAHLTAGTAKHFYTTGGGTITIDIIDTIIATIAHHGYTPNRILMNPSDLAKVLALLESATTADYFQGFFDEEAKLKGTEAIRVVRGLKVLTNAWVSIGDYYIFDASVRPVAFFEKRPITVEKDARPGFGIIGTWYSARYGVKCILPEAAAKYVE